MGRWSRTCLRNWNISFARAKFRFGSRSRTNFDLKGLCKSLLGARMRWVQSRPYSFDGSKMRSRSQSRTLTSIMIRELDSFGRKTRLRLPRKLDRTSIN